MTYFVILGYFDVTPLHIYFIPAVPVLVVSPWTENQFILLFSTAQKCRIVLA